MKQSLLALNIIALLILVPSNGFGGELDTTTTKTKEANKNDVLETTTTSSSPKTTTFIPRQQTVDSVTTTLKPNLNTDQVVNFSIPRDKPLETCLKVKISVFFEIDYLKTNDTNKSTLRFDLDELNDYDGDCNPTLNTLKIRFRNDWMLKMNYTLVDKTYQLESISLDYTVDSNQFPNASQNELGHRKANAENLGLFSTLVGNSFKCTSDTKVKLFNSDKQQQVSMLIRNYHGQPFMSADKPKEFGTAVECIGDKLSANKLVPIIVGSVLAALVLVILISYIVGRRKHSGNPTYQQV